MTIWSDLEAAAEARPSILSLFDDPSRAETFSAGAGDLFFDYSKTAITRDTRDKLVALALGRGVGERRDGMFAGAEINETEGRAVLHTALRADSPVIVNGRDVTEAARETLSRMEAFAEGVRAGNPRGPGEPVTDVVNIGIGGSDLGPAMATRALAPFHDGPAVHFVSNVDGADIGDTLARLDPARTLVIVASKTFTTIETMTNARTARDWMAGAVPDPGGRFAALSSASGKAREFGVPPDAIFGFEDWVGGRYSMWGAIGLSLMIAIGPERFGEMLGGSRAIDDHFRSAPPMENMPILLALIGLWHHQFCGFPTRAVLPYEHRLGRLPAYLQQLEMESNGKRVAMDGSALVVDSGPVVWGEPGTNGQHAFYQLIHQGTRIVPCEFMVGASGFELDHHHGLLVANCLAQSEALMKGRGLDEAREMLSGRYHGDELERQAAHRVFPGDRPSTTLVYPRLTPSVLGQIVALYEHRVFVEGVILGINSFDQWGVELGKELATALVPIVGGEKSAGDKDGSTRMLVAKIRGWN